MIRKAFSCGIFFLILIGCSKISFAQLIVSDTLTPEQYVKDVLIGSGITVENITYKGKPMQMGSFNGENSNIGFKSGLLLTSGSINNAKGPNTINSNLGTDSLNNMPDADLSSLSGSNIKDICILEFDFIPLTDSIIFRYVFGSEEYYLDTSSSNNDAFGFFLSGPGITGPYSNNAKNIATFGDPQKQLTIKNLNCQNGSAEYVCNTLYPGNVCAPLGYNCPNLVSETTVDYDGFSIPLTAVSKVIPCQKYHIKIAIADALDYAYDSGVFLEAGSFSASLVKLTGQTSTVENEDEISIVEGCDKITIKFSKPFPTSTTENLTLEFSGTAIKGQDFFMEPDIQSIIIPPGSVLAEINFTSDPDNLQEGNEFVKMYISQNLCGKIYKDSLVINLIDVEPLVADVTAITEICSGEEVIFQGNKTGGYGNLIYNWNDGQWTTQNIAVSPEISTNYKLKINDECGRSSSDSLYLNVIEYPVPDFTLSGENCQYGYVNVTFSGSALDTAYYTWNFSDAEIISGEGMGPYMIKFNTIGEKNISLSLRNSDCVSPLKTISYQVNECPVEFPNVFTPNGDGINDYLKFKYLNLFPGSKLVIFNRWGNKVFESKDYRNNWDGESFKEGVYYYVLKINSPASKAQNGMINIIR